MVSVRYSCALVSLLALQGCGMFGGDEGICEAAKGQDDKEVKLCCADGKPGAGSPKKECCEKKDDGEIKTCLKDEVQEKAGVTPGPPAANTEAAATATAEGATETEAAATTEESKLETSNNVVVNSRGRAVRREK